VFVPRDEVGIERWDSIEVGLGCMFDIGAEAARKEGDHKRLGCLCYDVIVEVLLRL